MAVHLDRPPHGGRLMVWGRAPHDWWGLVTWRQRVLVNGEPDELPMAAWLPASSISRPAWSSTVELPRIDLPGDQRDWPPPPGWPCWFIGPWPNGPLALPPGAQRVTGPAWQQRRRR